MKPAKQKSPPQTQTNQHSARTQPEHHNLLEYYKSKIDSLYNERLAWLSKFDQCKSKLNEKHNLKQKLLQQRNDQRDLSRAIVHHQVALLDEKLNVIRMDRENMMHDYRDAEEVIKIGDIMEQYPNEIQKMLPCNPTNHMASGDMIRNELNIHTSKEKKTAASRSTKKQPPNSFNIKHSFSQKQSKNYDIINPKNSQPGGNQTPPQKITQQELLQRQLIQIQQNQKSEIETMQQLKCKLEQLIKKTQEQQKLKLSQERQIVNQLNQEYKELDKKHKDLAEDYFAGRRKQKQNQQDLQKQKEELIKKNQTLQEKVNKQLKVYEKQNKAKQTLILKKSQDFQENYKAKMRAKQRNLQALKQNYEKMQTICIEKVTKLQNALNKAKNKLKESQDRKEFLVDELREQLHTLEKRVQEQKLEREQRELKLRIKAEKDKAKLEEERQRREREQVKAERNRLVEESYKRTLKKPQRSLSREKNGRSNKSLPKAGKGGRKDIYGKPGEESEDDESLEMDDLDNIRRQIGELETKIAADTK